MAPYLRECLDSIHHSVDMAGEGLERLVEIIIVEDHSTDNSLSICKNYASCDHFNVKLVVHDKNMGILTTRRDGLNSATGEYVVWVDSDDIVDRQWMPMIAAAVKNHPADLYAFDIERLYPDGQKSQNLYGKNILGLDAPAYIDKDFYAKDVLRTMRNWSYLVTKVIRRDLYRNVDFSAPGGAMEDARMMLDLLPNVKTAYYIPKALYTYRSRASGQVSNIDSACRVRHIVYTIERLPLIPANYRPAAAVSLFQELVNVSRDAHRNMQQVPAAWSRQTMRQLLLAMWKDKLLTFKQKLVFTMFSFKWLSDFAGRKFGGW